MNSNESKSNPTSIDNVQRITCKVHGSTEIILDTVGFKLLCKKCIVDGIDFTGNLSNEGNQVIANVEGNDNCDIHSTEKIIFYCEDCRDCLCKKCYENHKGHATLLVQDLKEKIKTTLKKNQDKLGKVVQGIEESQKVMTEINNQLKGFVSKTKLQISSLMANIEKILKEKMSVNQKNFANEYKGLDTEVEDSYKRLELISRKCNKLAKELADIDQTMKIQRASSNTCQFLRNISGTVSDAKKLIADAKQFLGEKILTLRAKGEDKLKEFKSNNDLIKKRESIYEKSITNAILTGATSETKRVRRFFKYTIEDLSYFRTSSVFFNVSKKIFLNGIGCCGLLKSHKVERNLKMSISVNEISGGEIVANLITETVNLHAVTNPFDPVCIFYLSKIVTLLSSKTYAITVQNLEQGNHYLEIWRGMVYLPSNQQELFQELRCNNSRTNFRFIPSKGIESDFNEFGIGIISDVIYSSEV